MRCAVSVDLDSIACYYRIHGLGDAPSELASAILDRALPRARALFARHRLRATWFVVGRDVDSAGVGGNKTKNSQQLQQLVSEGDELANHSYSHPYDLARLSPAEVEREIENCDRVLRSLGATVRGFRAPGYDVSPVMLEALVKLGYRYDSSVFPAPPYYAAKAVVMTALAALRRPSGAVLTNPRLLAAPPIPYRLAMDSPWRRGQAPLVELPIATTPWLRLHAIGTTLILAPAWLRAHLIEGMARRSFWNLELHGIDFADAAQDGLPDELVSRQPDLRLPIDEKLERIDRVLEQVTRRWDMTTLGEFAAEVQREG